MTGPLRTIDDVEYAAMECGIKPGTVHCGYPSSI
jgi:hypothetical protein